MAPYELRSGGDVKNKKQSVADLKYRRLTELNGRLKEDLDRPRVKVSEAALSSVQPFDSTKKRQTKSNTFNSLISYCNNTRDFMVPSVWGQVCDRLFLSTHRARPYPKTNTSILLGRQARGSLRSSATGRLLHRHVMHSRRELFAMTHFALISLLLFLSI